MPDNNNFFDAAAGYDANNNNFAFTRRHFLQIVLLISAVPMQYFLTRSSSETFRNYQLHNVISGLSELREKYSNIISYWAELCTNLFGVWGKTNFDQASSSAVDEDDVEEEEKLLPETVRSGDKKEDGLYGSSTEVRSPRPPFVQYRVGQVIRHKAWKYRGVIVGWDERAKAPDWWLDEMHPQDKPHWRNWPNYAVLVDTRDRLTPQMSYVVQENIEIVTDLPTAVLHPLIEFYFEYYDRQSSEYVARPWLKNVYPHD